MKLKYKKAKHKRYHSLTQKMIVIIISSTLLSTLVFITIFYFFSRNQAIENNIIETEKALKISTQNMDYYLKNSIDGARSIYLHPDILALLAKREKGNFTSEELEHIERYLSSIYYSNTSSVQIHLMAFRSNQSFLFRAKNMQFSHRTKNYFEGDLKKVPALNTVTLIPTHEIDSYEHILFFQTPEEKQNDVFTICFPIFNLPKSDDPLGMIEIDFPISFFNENCQLLYSKGQEMYIVNQDNIVMAASNSCKILSKSELPSSSFAKIVSNETRYSIEGQNLWVGQVLNSNYFDWILLKKVSLHSILNETLSQMLFLLLIVSFSIVIATFFSISLLARYTQTLKTITNFINILSETDGWEGDNTISSSIHYKENDEILSLITSFDKMFKQLNYHIAIQYQLKIDTLKANFDALQMQINPHFIYNSLQSFATRALEKNDLEQYRLISSFGQMLHYAMATQPELVTLEEEVLYCKRYINLQQMRFKMEAEISYQISPETKTFPLPRLTLQPLVENAIIHGKILQKTFSSLILTSYIADAFLCIEIIDNGNAITDIKRLEIVTAIEDIRKHFMEIFLNQKTQDSILLNLSQCSFTEERKKIDKKSCHALGLKNVYLRLLIYFGPECSFDIYSNNYDGTTVCMKIPLSKVSGLSEANQLGQIASWTSE